MSIIIDDFIVYLNRRQIANDSESILDYFEDVFGERARRPVVVAEPEWYFQ